MLCTCRTWLRRAWCHLPVIATIGPIILLMSKFHQRNRKCWRFHCWNSPIDNPRKPTLRCALTNKGTLTCLKIPSTVGLLPSSVEELHQWNRSHALSQKLLLAWIYSSYISHFGKLLHFQILLLAIMASSPMRFNSRFLSPPAIPMSLRNDAIEAAGKPLHPTSTAHVWTFQPFAFPLFL